MYHVHVHLGILMPPINGSSLPLHSFPCFCRPLLLSEGKRSEMIRGMPCISNFNQSSGAGLDDDSDSCSSTSVGKDSVFDEEDNEMQSSLRGPLDTMDALEDALPVEKGISKFYNGKSKSFTSLADAKSLNSIKDIVKPENPYIKKRKNLLLKNNYPLSSRKDINAGASKRKDNIQEGHSISHTSGLPPLHPQGRTVMANESSFCPTRQNHPCRSFSLSDLQCASGKASDMSQFIVFNGNKCNQLCQGSSFDSFNQLRKVEERSW